MIPVLYQKRASDFENNGIGRLIDTVSCKVIEERNGSYELTLQYPISGAWYSDIHEGSIIKARVNDEENKYQLFRIYKSSKPLKGIVTFYARHISYDLSGYPVKPFSIEHANASLVANVALSSSLLEHDFVAEVDISTNTDTPFTVTKPKSVRGILGGDEESILSTWEGEFEWDNFHVKFTDARGADNGTVIRYGKNLTDAKQERNINDCYTHFCPYAVVMVDATDDVGTVVGKQEQVITLSDGLIELIDPEDIGHNRAYTLDITDMFLEDEEFNEENLRAHANEYIDTHALGVPSINITVSFLDIWNTPEYENVAALERCRLCDIITVYFDDLGINAKAKVIKTEYDCLLERFTKIEVGDAKNTLADSFSNIKGSVAETQKELLNEENKATTALQNAILEATNKITGSSGGYVVLNPPNYPEEILIMDTPLKSKAKNVWRWNSAGLGFSSNGYEGPYETAITMDGKIVADFITTGTLNAIKVKGSTIEGGTININNNFVVDGLGNVTIRSGGGGRNYILDSDQSDTLGTQKKTYTLSESLVSGEKYTLSICYTTMASTSSFVFTVGAQPVLLSSNSAGKQTITQTFTAGSSVSGITSASLARSGSSLIHWVKLERGGIATDWTPAPEATTNANRINLEGYIGNISNTFSIGESGHATFTGGTIGGWTIAPDGIYKGTTKLLTDDAVKDTSLVDNATLSPIRIAIGLAETSAATTVETYEIVTCVEGTLNNSHRDFSKWGKITHIEVVGCTDDYGDTEYTINVSIDEDGHGYTITGDNDIGPYNGDVYVDIKITYKLEGSNLKILDDGSIYASAGDFTGTVNAKKGAIGGWHLDEVTIPISASENVKARALFSDEMYDSSKRVTYQIYLTPKGVYSTGRDSAGDTQYLHKTWFDILNS